MNAVPKVFKQQVTKLKWCIWCAVPLWMQHKDPYDMLVCCGKNWSFVPSKAFVYPFIITNRFCICETYTYAKSYEKLWLCFIMLFFITLRPRQNGHRFTDDSFKQIFLNENIRIAMKISLKFVPNGPINNNPELVQIMAWRRSGDKPISEPMMVSLLMHICVTRPQWVISVAYIFLALTHQYYCLE